MTRRKNVCFKWTLVLLVIVCPYISARPQESPVFTTSSEHDVIPIRQSSTKSGAPDSVVEPTPSSIESSARDAKKKAPIRDSIEMVAIQLLNKPNNSVDAPLISDIRIPPKLKPQVKNKIKTKNGDEDHFENTHLGEAVPVIMEDLDTENKLTGPVSSTPSEGISTWTSFSNATKENTSTEPTKVEEKDKKPKPAKSKPKRPQTNKISKRPIIGSTNKADLVAGGSAISENVYNKLKNTVLANVEKNKNASVRPSTTPTTTTIITTTTTTDFPTTKKEVKIPISPSVTVTTRPKKKNKNKPKTSTTSAPSVIEDSAMLPTEAKEQEIELEVSTPAMTTKKPKRSSNKKKNKTKRRKTTTSKPSTETAIADVKTSNKTKSNKNSKKPAVAQNSAITTQIYNYLSREVMPSVGVGVLGLASLVGIAGYFLYPFATPVRRTFEVDKSDDLYRNNAEEYANDGNGQAEEEMLGTVLAGMPAHAKQKLNPYAAQTPHISRYPVKKEQDIRYRQVTPSYNSNYKVHYAQQKTGIAHGAVYSKPASYTPYERHAYTTEPKYTYEKPKQPNYTPYSAAAVEPIYAAPHTGPSSSGISAYGSEASNSVVYGIKPSPESDFKPVYPFDGQHFSETTSSPVTYPPTSMYLGMNKNANSQDDLSNDEDYTNLSSEGSENQFVVGNVPKELSESATPAVVPEHGPRKLRKRRSISDSFEDFHYGQDSDKDVFISNEIDDYYNMNPKRKFRPSPISLNEIAFTPTSETKTNVEPADASNAKLNVIRSVIEPAKTTVLTESTDDGEEIYDKETAINSDEESTTRDNMIVESISTAPIDNPSNKETTTELYDDTEQTETETSNATQGFESESTSKTKPTQTTSMPTPTTTPSSTTTSTKTTTSELKHDAFTVTTVRPKINPVEVTTDVIVDDPDLTTYPPPSEFNIYSLLQKLVVFKLKLGLGLLQSTVDVLNKIKTDTAKAINHS